MGYTLTLDMPQKATEYIERCGARFQNELSAIVLTFVTTQMRHEDVPTSTQEEETSSASTKTGLDLFRALRRGGPLLDDDEMHIFDRMKDYGREVELA